MKCAAGSKICGVTRKLELYTKSKQALLYGEVCRVEAEIIRKKAELARKTASGWSKCVLIRLTAELKGLEAELAFFTTELNKEREAAQAALKKFLGTDA